MTEQEKKLTPTEKKTPEALSDEEVSSVAGGTEESNQGDLVTYIKRHNLTAGEIADCDYVSAGVKLTTDDLIKEETEVEITEFTAGK